MRLLAGALMLLGLVYGLSAYPLLEPDEGRNAEVAREMAASHDYFFPRLDGLPYVDKPVLFFAVEAATMNVLGPTTLAARLPPLLFTLATIGVIAWFAARRSGRRAAWTAAIATGATPLALGFARTVIFDSALTLFVVVALVAFFEATDGPQRPTGDARPSPRWEAWHWSAIAWTAVALAVLTKGPIGLALPLMVAIPFAVWRRAGRAIWEPVGPLLFAAMVLPWVMLMSQRVPRFLAYALGTETLLRLTTPALGRTGPWWYFLPILLVGALPWSLAALGGFRGAGRWRSGQGKIEPYTLFLLLWIVVPLLFFSLSQSKRPQYVLPLIPAIALLVAEVSRQGERLRGAGAAAAGLVIVGLALVAASRVLPRLTRLSPEIEVTLVPVALGLAAVCAAAGALVWVLRERYDAVLLLLALPTAAVPVAGMTLMQAIGRERSSVNLAAAISAAAPDDATVLAIHSFPVSLPFYLRRQVLVATSTGRELTSNYLMRDVSRWRDAPGSPLRPADEWLEAATTCDRIRIFVTRASDTPVRTVLAGKLPLLVETATYAAYGPCTRSNLAWDQPSHRIRFASPPVAMPPSLSGEH